MDSKENLKDSRSLRSKGIEDSSDDNRFDFEQDEYSIDPNKKFLILHSRVRQDDQEVSIDRTHQVTDDENDYVSNNTDSKIELDLNLKSDKLDVQKSKGLITSMILDIKTNRIDEVYTNRNDVSMDGNIVNNNVTKTLVDPLSDETYTSFHKKMLKQENRMHQFDVNQGINEAERLDLIYDKLDLPNWVSTLQRVTIINDPTDEKELLEKKIMTKQHIKSLLNKYNRMQKRNRFLQKCIKRIRTIPIQRTAKIYQNLDRKCDIDYHSSSDEEQDECSIDNAEICRRRLQRKETQCGGSIIIGISYTELHKSKFFIMAEPLKKPYIFMASKEERQSWKFLTGIPKTLQGNVRTNNQIAEYKQKILIPLTLTAERLNKSVVASGTVVENKNNINRNHNNDDGDDNCEAKSKHDNNQNINDLQINQITEVTNGNDTSNKNLTENKMSSDNEGNNIRRDNSNQNIQLENSCISSSDGSTSLLLSTSTIKTDPNNYENITMNEKQNKSIITRSESYDVVTSRLCASEPCINFFGEETGNNNIEKRIYSVEEDIDNRRSTPTIAEYRHMNNRNIMSISSITNGTLNSKNYQNGSDFYKSDSDKYSVNILKVKKKLKLSPIEGTTSDFSNT